MKLIVSSIVFMMAAGMLFAADSGISNTQKKPRRNRLIESGGLVSRCVQGKVVQIYDAHGVVPKEIVNSVISEIQSATNIAVKYSDIDLEDNAVATVEIIDVDGAAPIANYPEEYKCVLNARTLKLDGPNDDLLATRFRKQIWRSVAFALGAGYSNGPYTVMRPFASLKDMDACVIHVVGPETLNVMMKTAKDRGCASIITTTYRQACREGWAPLPENDIQKKLWDEAHQLPTAPKVIKFEKSDIGK